MKSTLKSFFNDKHRLANVVSIVMLVHVLCGLLRYLLDIRVVLAIDYLCYGAAILFGAAYAMLNRAWAKRQFTSGMSEILLMCLYIWAVLSTVLNIIFVGLQNAYYAPNALLDFTLLIFLYFPYGKHIARHGAERLTRILFNALLLAWSAFILVVLICVFNGRNIHLPGDIELGFYGKHPNSLALNNNPNHTSCIECVFMGACAFMAFKARKRWLKPVYVLCALIHYCAMALSDSRTFFLCSLMLFGAMCFFAIFKRLNVQKIALKLLISAFLALCCAAVFYYGKHLLFKLHPTGSEKTIVYTEITTLSNRTNLWQNALKSINLNPFRWFFGVGIANSKSVNLEFANVNGYMHNQLLEIAVCLGVPALILFVFFALKSFTDAIRLSFSKPLNLTILYLSGCLAMLFAANMFEALLMFYRRPGSYAFFVIAGWLCETVRKRNNLRPCARNPHNLTQQTPK